MQAKSALFLVKGKKKKKKPSVRQISGWENSLRGGRKKQWLREIFWMNYVQDKIFVT